MNLSLHPVLSAPFIVAIVLFGFGANGANVANGDAHAFMRFFSG